MELETFYGRDLPHVLTEVRKRFGEDAMILSTRSERTPGGPRVEVVAARGDDLLHFRQRIEAGGARPPRRGIGRPYVVALVGSTGAGKTTTIAKLALHPAAFGGSRIGIITLDTYRVAALEQIETYAEILGVPLEVVYREAEVEPAMQRLADCDVVLVDTPGRSPQQPRLNLEWRALLQRIRPDEVHLVVPASLRTDVALSTRDAYAACGLSHALLTKLDEVPGERGVAELAARLDLPARWVTTGQEVPADLHPAGARLLHSLCAEAGLEAGALAGV